MAAAAPDGPGMAAGGASPREAAVRSHGPTTAAAAAPRRIALGRGRAPCRRSSVSPALPRAKRRHTWATRQQPLHGSSLAQGTVLRREGGRELPAPGSRPGVLMLWTPPNSA